MVGIDLDKAVSRRLGCGGVAGSWRKLLLLVALVTSALALFASFFFSTFRISDSFLSSSPVLDSLQSVAVANSSSPPPTSPPPPSAPLYEQYLIARGQVESPAPAAPPAFSAPALSPDGDFDALEVGEGEYDSKIPPLEAELVLSPSPSFVHIPTVPPPSPVAHPSAPVANLFDIRANSSKTDGITITSFSPKAPTISTPPPPPPPPPRPIEISTAAEVNLRSPAAKVPPFWRELMDAKKKILTAPAVLGDPDLHAPIFLNVSTFKRSYELMERVLKVYIYKDGPKPLFHTPELGGIYASEGWFMKLMEENKHFVTKDPTKAHLFYMAYSSRQLRAHLYVPDSHTSKPLSIFLRNYVNMIAAKYPFWNRTSGADHFLVACHDWATYTTRLHDELRKNAIKAVCNADVSEGVFIRGKDVSLPETYIRAPKRPQRGTGGNPPAKRPFLAFFAGHMHGRVRPILLQFWRERDPDMKIYEALPPEIARRMSYIQHMKSSKFCICPMGYEVNSPRIVEAIYYECVPVIIADNFVLPFEEVLDWRAFSVVVAEKDIGRLKEILTGVSAEMYSAMQMNVRKLQRHFLWNVRPRKYDLFHMILHSIWFNRLNQIDL